MLRYQNFDLLLNTKGDALHVHVINSEAGQDDEQALIPNGLFHYKDALAELSTKDKTMAFGTKLFQALFPPQIESIYRRSLDRANHEGEGLRVRIHTTESDEIAAIPWEFVYDPKDERFLVQSSKISVAHYLHIPQEVKCIEARLPLRILVAIASPEDREGIDGDEEWAALQASLSDLVSGDEIQLERLQPCTKRELRERLQTGDYHILHFIGHGESTSPLGEGGIVLETEGARESDLYSYSDLANDVSESPNLQLLFLNACSTAADPHTSRFDGAAQRAVRRGAPAVIGMRFDISNEAATKLAFEFYRSLANGDCVDEALAAGRRLLSSEEDSNEWGYPVLFLRSNESRLFKLEDIQDQEAEEVLSEYVVHPEELERIQGVFVPPGNGILERITETVRDNKLIVIEGPAGVGKSTLATMLAQRLLSDQSEATILRVHWNTPIEHLRGVRDSIIIAENYFGPTEFQRDQLDAELPALDRLLQGNSLVVTSPTQVLEKAIRETRLGQWAPIWEGRVELSPEDYDADSRLAIIHNHLRRKVEHGRISKEVATRLERALGGSKNLVSSPVLPSDLQRTVLRLPAEATQEEIEKLVAHATNPREEIENWLLHSNATDAIRDELVCFFVAATVFAESRRDSFWEWYTATASMMRSIVPHVAARPLATLSPSLMPYVKIGDTSWSFAHVTIEVAFRKVLCEKVREFLCMLLPDILRAIVPPDSMTKEERWQFLERTKEIRRSAAMVMGELGKTNLEPLRSTLEELAGAAQERVRLVACEVLERASSSKAQVGPAMRIVRGWAAREENSSKRWTAVMTCGRMQSVAEFSAINRLKRLASDQKDYYVRAAVPRALERFVESCPTEVLAVMTKLGADTSPKVRAAVSQSLRRIRSKEPAFVEQAIQKWRELESKNRLWTLIQTCWIDDAQSELALQVIAEAVEKHNHLAARTLLSSIQHEYLTVNDAFDRFEALLAFRRNVAKYLVRLMTALREHSDTTSWSRLTVWSKNGSANQLRFFAAHIVAHWRADEPRRTQPILSNLESGFDEELAMVASNPPMEIVTMDEIADLFHEKNIDEKTPGSSSDSWMREVMI